MDKLHHCLGALRIHRSLANFEVIVVANGATSDVHRVINCHDWVTPIFSRANRGFAGGANLGAAHARGSRLAFLNDDAVITEGWLDAMNHVLDSRPGTAAVGSLVIDANGRVLEFGSAFIGMAPTSLDRGRRLDELAMEPPRDVPFASACSLLVERDVFERIGGFDEAYYPAYFEDADLGLRIWEAGHAVSVTPASVIVHAESASTTNVQREIMFEASSRVFHSRWFGRMLGDCSDSAGKRLPRRHKPIILIDDFVPRAEAGSGLARARQTVVALTSIGHPVLFHARERRFELDAVLLARGVRVVSDLAQLPDDLEPQCVIASRPTNFELGEKVAQRFGVALIYDAEARFSARIETELLLDVTPERRLKMSDELEKMLACESRAARDSHVVVTISSSEADWFSAQGAASVHMVSPFPDRCDMGEAGFDERDGAVFIAGWLGGAATPNGDGLRWFAEAVLPRVILQDPAFRLRVTGADPPAELLELASPHLDFVGEVQDLHALMKSVRVAICPIRYGAGVKIKVVDALSCGLPVLSTSIGIEGIEDKWHFGVKVTDDADEFADALVELCNTKAAWQALRAPLVANCNSHHLDAGSKWGEIIGSVRSCSTRSEPVSEMRTHSTTQQCGARR